MILENNNKKISEDEEIKKYILYHKDEKIAYLLMNYDQIYKIAVLKNKIDRFPLAGATFLLDIKGKTEKETDTYYDLNEEGIGCFEINWLNERETPLIRENYQKYGNNKIPARKRLLQNYACSFSDCYYIVPHDSRISCFRDICRFMYGIEDFHQIMEKSENKGFLYHGVNSSLGGQLEKFWYKENNNIRLCKLSPPGFDIMAAREMFAKEVFDSQKISLPPGITYTSYHPAVRDEKIIGVSCPLFTDESKELVTAYDLLASRGKDQSPSVYEDIIDIAHQYGLREQVASDYMDIQTMIDCLLLNRDRHENNIGFLRDTNSLKIISPAPCYDFGSTKSLEERFPEQEDSMTVNSLYPTERECLAHVKNPMLVNISALPDKDVYLKILDLFPAIPDERKNQVASLYEIKKAYLEKMQEEYLKEDKIEEYNFEK